MKSLLFLFVICIAISNPQVRGYQKFVSTAAFTAQMTSSYDYDVTANPITISVIFSDTVSKFDESMCTLVNCGVKEITKKSKTEYSVSIVPDSPGFLSISLTRSIKSDANIQISSPPILEFNYIGAEVTSTRITNTAETTATITVVTSKSAIIYAYYISGTSKTEPSSSTIISQAQVSSESAGTNHVLMLTGLTEGTLYSIYLAGKEATGTLMKIDSTKSPMKVTTKSSSGEQGLEDMSDGTICESGYGMTSTSTSIEMLACSYHGYCKQSKCVCVDYYTGSNCANILEDPLETTNSTHQLIHAQLKLTGTFKEATKLEAYWKVSLRQIIADRLSLSPNLVQIRHWDFFNTEVSSLSYVDQHVRSIRGVSMNPQATSEQVLNVYITVVTSQNMLLLVTKRLNEMIADNDIKKGLSGKLITISSAQVVNTFAQVNEDSWSCYDGELNYKETDTDCGGECKNGCTLQQSCSVQSDCVDGLYCTKGKCIDRNWKQVFVTTFVIICLIIVAVIVIIVGGIIYQKVKAKK